MATKLTLTISIGDRSLLMGALNEKIFRDGGRLSLLAHDFSRRAEARRLSREVTGMRRLREMLMAEKADRGESRTAQSAARK